MKWSDGSANVVFEGGPADGQSYALTPHQVSMRSIKFPLLRDLSVETVVYVPHPSDPDNVWVIDAERSDPGTAAYGSRTCLRLNTADYGSEAVTLFGYSGKLVTAGDVHQALDMHRLLKFRDPVKITVTTELTRH